ncbi:MAG: hypothetical protein PHT60_11955 [Acidiphilium sp.]|nr:hypothetical protein [Acidiphilium sp.]MDD4936476.1 hypothetical protein [Acidiphilium sp.]
MTKHSQPWCRALTIASLCTALGGFALVSTASAQAVAGETPAAHAGAQVAGRPFDRAHRLEHRFEQHMAMLHTIMKITPAEQPAWTSYTAAVQRADQRFFHEMRANFRPGKMVPLDPEQRFAALSRHLDLAKARYEAEHSAAETLVPHLTAYQQGQASIILPGLGTTGFGPGFGPHPHQGPMH